MTRKKKVALVLFSDPVIYPPTMNAAAILAENNVDVEIIAIRCITEDRIQTPDGVKIIYFGPMQKGLMLRWQYLRFCYWFIKYARDRQYDWILSYNMMSCLPAYLGKSFSEAKWLYHNHDISPVEQSWGFYASLKQFEYWSVRRAELVTFPQLERAEIFAAEANLSQKPIIVMNGPRLSWANVQQLDQELIMFKKKHKYVAIYQGGLNWMRGLRQLICSMPLWNSKAGLCLVGKADLQPTFLVEAMKLAQSLGVADRLLIRHAVQYNALPSLTKVCDIGIGVMSTEQDDSSPNIRFLAGASNKLVEYMACGLPILVPNNESYQQYVEKPGIGLMANPEDSLSIANTVDTLLTNTELHDKMAECGRVLFESELSFDAQFEPILRRMFGE